MQRNCGVLAYDKLVGELNGRSNIISMDTLAKLATDNGFLLYPTKVPVHALGDIPMPCIIYTNHHFTVLEDSVLVEPVCVERDYLYILTHELVNPEWIMTEAEAKEIRGADIGQMFTPPKGKSPWEAMTNGSTGGWAGWAGNSNPVNSDDPKGWGWVGPVLNTVAGAVGNAIMPGLGTIGSTIGGAIGMNGGKTGYQGSDYGNANWGSTIAGAGIGALEGIGGTYAAQGLGGLAGGGGITSSTWGQAVPWLSGLGGAGATGGSTSTGLGNIAAAGTGGSSMTANSAAASGVGSNWLSGLTSAFDGSTGTSAAGTGGGLSGFNFNSLMQLGSGILGMMNQNSGNSTLSSPDFMNLPEVQQFAASIGKAKTQLGQMSQDQLAAAITAAPGSIIPDDNAYFQAATRRVQEQGTLQKQQVTEAYNSIGRANSSEHMQALALVDKQTAQAVQDTAATLANQKLQLEITYKTAALAQALQVDQNTAADLAGLTKLSVTEAALKYGVSEAQVQQIRTSSGLENMYGQLSGSQGNSAGSMNSIMNMINSLGI